LNGETIEIAIKASWQPIECLARLVDTCVAACINAGRAPEKTQVLVS
jgi:hypothetical protein